MASGRKVLGLVPPTGRYVREDRCQAPVDDLKAIALRPPIDLLYAAGAFESVGATCRVHDFPAEGRTWHDLDALLQSFQPQDVLLSITTQTLAEDMKAAQRVKHLLPKARVFAKGAHFSVYDRESLAAHPALDGVLRGEIEETCQEIGRNRRPATIVGLTWRAPDGTIVRNADRPFPTALDDLPFPARHLIDNTLYARPDTGAPQTSIVTNRGCPFHCSYCLANLTAGTRNRHRSVANVLAEIRECVERLGIRDFLFRSDLFTQNRPWVLELCDAITSNGLDIAWACNARVDSVDAPLLRAMRRAGCWIVAFGVESGDQTTLNAIDKRQTVEDSFAAVRACREAGVLSCAYLMMGFPWDTPASLAALSDFARRLDPDLIEVFFPYPFPGTPLREQLVRAGLIGTDEMPTQSYAAPAFATHRFSADTLLAERKRLLRQFYLRPRTIARTLGRTRSITELGNVVRVGLAQLRMILTPA